MYDMEWWRWRMAFEGVKMMKMKPSQQGKKGSVWKKETWNFGLF